MNHKIDFLPNLFHRKNCNWISNLFSMPIYKMQLQHATPKNLLQKFSKSISFLMNGNSLQNLLRSIDIAQSLCLRKQKVEKWFYFITVILWMKIKMESPLCMTMKRWKIQISLIFCHDGFWTSICAWLYILMLSLWQNKPHSTSLVNFFFISDQFQTLSHSQLFDPSQQKKTDCHTLHFWN